MSDYVLICKFCGQPDYQIDGCRCDNDPPAPHNDQARMEVGDFVQWLEGTESFTEIMDAILHREAAVRQAAQQAERERYMEAIATMRDAILNQRAQLAERIIDNDIINDVLGIIDDNTPGGGA